MKTLKRVFNPIPRSNLPRYCNKNGKLSQFFQDIWEINIVGKWRLFHDLWRIFPVTLFTQILKIRRRKENIFNMPKGLKKALTFARQRWENTLVYHNRKSLWRKWEIFSRFPRERVIRKLPSVRAVRRWSTPWNHESARFEKAGLVAWTLWSGGQQNGKWAGEEEPFLPISQKR